MRWLSIIQRIINYSNVKIFQIKIIDIKVQADKINITNSKIKKFLDFC